MRNRIPSGCGPVSSLSTASAFMKICPRRNSRIPEIDDDREIDHVDRGLEYSSSSDSARCEAPQHQKDRETEEEIPRLAPPRPPDRERRHIVVGREGLHRQPAHVEEDAEPDRHRRKAAAASVRTGCPRPRRRRRWRGCRRSAGRSPERQHEPPDARARTGLLAQPCDGDFDPAPPAKDRSTPSASRRGSAGSDSHRAHAGLR